jgi:hypothetical protein
MYKKQLDTYGNAETLMGDLETPKVRKATLGKVSLLRNQDVSISCIEFCPYSICLRGYPSNSGSTG